VDDLSRLSAIGQLVRFGTLVTLHARGASPSSLWTLSAELMCLVVVPGYTYCELDLVPSRPADPPAPRKPTAPQRVDHPGGPIAFLRHSLYPCADYQ